MAKLTSYTYFSLAESTLLACSAWLAMLAASMLLICRRACSMSAGDMLCICCIACCIIAGFMFPMLLIICCICGWQPCGWFQGQEDPRQHDIGQCHQHANQQAGVLHPPKDFTPCIMQLCHTKLIGTYMHGRLPQMPMPLWQFKLQCAFCEQLQQKAGQLLGLYANLPAQETSVAKKREKARKTEG